MSDTHAASHAHGYRHYWIAWFILLILTVVMISIHNKSVLLAGIGLKSFIICLWFMHLKYERRWLLWSVAAGFVFALALFFFIHYDAQLTQIGL